jgi:hypothetical protein
MPFETNWANFAQRIVRFFEIDHIVARVNPVLIRVQVIERGIVECSAKIAVGKYQLGRSIVNDAALNFIKNNRMIIRKIIPFSNDFLNPNNPA